MADRVQAQVLSAEIGSTTTVVSAFSGMNTRPQFLGQGSAPTSVNQGDVRIGLWAAIENLKSKLNTQNLEWERFFASSSAAGGLKMSVHGLVYDMTVKAAREAALGAGANLSMVTAGPLQDFQLEELTEIQPNIIMIAGGVDHGERETALGNARLILRTLKENHLTIPVIYAGNRDNHFVMEKLFRDSGIPLYITRNVYPRIDELVIEPARKIIQNTFEEHIIRAPGMEHIREMVDGNILPVPGAVMRSAQALREKIGDVLVFDVGGATTDLHSVCADSPEIERILIAPEPQAKRTVEGDLGVYVNRLLVLQTLGAEKIAQEMEMSASEVIELIQNLPSIPKTDPERRAASCLTYHAARIALERHAGGFRDLYTISGKKKLAEGKDLTGIGIIIGTGGALTRLPGGREILQRVLHSGKGQQLFPQPHTPVHLDKHYIFATLGVLLDGYPDGALTLLLESLELNK